MQKSVDGYIEKLENWINEAFQKNDKYLFQDPAYDLLDEVETLDNKADFLEPIFRLIERSPDIDFGGPGPFGTFLEKFRDDYIKELLESIKRKPTKYTVFMLNRLCNAKDNPKRDEYIMLLKTFADCDFLDEYWKQAIAKY